MRTDPRRAHHAATLDAASRGPGEAGELHDLRAPVLLLRAGGAVAARTRRSHRANRQSPPRAGQAGRPPRRPLQPPSRGQELMRTRALSGPAGCGTSNACEQPATGQQLRRFEELAAMTLPDAVPASHVDLSQTLLVIPCSGEKKGAQVRDPLQRTTPRRSRKLHPTLSRPPRRRLLPGADQAPTCPRRPHLRIRAHCLEDQVNAHGRVQQPRHLRHVLPLCQTFRHYRLTVQSKRPGQQPG
jgi:hypothetical protein